MAQPSIHDACIALADVIQTGIGLRAQGWVSDQINAPEAHVYTRDFDPRMTLGNSPKRAFMLGVRVFVQRTDPRSAQLTLRDFMEPTGDTSVLAAIEDETNWNVTIDYAEVTNIGQPFEFIGGSTAFQGGGTNEIYMAVDFDVDVIW